MRTWSRKWQTEMTAWGHTAIVSFKYSGSRTFHPECCVFDVKNLSSQSLQLSVYSLHAADTFTDVSTCAAFTCLSVCSCAFHLLHQSSSASLPQSHTVTVWAPLIAAATGGLFSKKTLTFSLHPSACISTPTTSNTSRMRHSSVSQQRLLVLNC